MAFVICMYKHLLTYRSFQISFPANAMTRRLFGGKVEWEQGSGMGVGWGGGGGRQGCDAMHRGIGR